MASVQDQLVSTLLEQSFVDCDNKDILLAKYQQLAQAHVTIDNGIAVLSDFQENCSYVYAGGFGHFFGLNSDNTTIDSAFEECIFSRVHSDDITERHVLELRYFQFQKDLPATERHKYSTFTRLRVLNPSQEYFYITHRTFYLSSLPDDNVLFALCLYAPSTDQSQRQGIEGKIINNETGEICPIDKYKEYDQTILSKRELEILILIASGKSSKQIAEQLSIATYTVHRHRQNIIRKMQVVNTTQAVKTALSMGLIIL